jgi:hypothetical protein
MAQRQVFYRCADKECVGRAIIAKSTQWNKPVHLGLEREDVASIISGAIGLSGTVKPEKQAEDAIKALIKYGVIEV